MLFYLKNIKEPFFIYYASQAIHVPHFPSDSIGYQPFGIKTIYPTANMVKELDMQVGAIIEELKRSGKYDNTFIVFTSDNGGLKVDRNIQDSNIGLRGSKRGIYEGGHRVPLIAVWKERILENTQNLNLTSTLDLLPTFADFMKVSNDKKLDGKSLKSELFSTDSPNDGKTKFLLHYTNKGDFAIRNGDWKFIYSSNKNLKKFKLKEVYNLNNNVTEIAEFNYINELNDKEIARQVSVANEILLSTMGQRIRK